MNSKLLDTNVIIRYIKDEGNLDDIFEEEKLFFSSVTLGELLFGAECSKRKEENVIVYSNFCSELDEIKPDSYGRPVLRKNKSTVKSRWTSNSRK